MTKQKTLLLIPIILITGSIIYCWYRFLTEDLTPVWRNYLAWFALIPLIYLFFKKGQFKKALIATGIYLILAVANIFSLQAAIVSTTFGIGGIVLPPFNSYSLLLLVVYIILNIDNLINAYLDYKEAKGKS